MNNISLPQLLAQSFFLVQTHTCLFVCPLQVFLCFTSLNWFRIWFSFRLFLPSPFYEFPRLLWKHKLSHISCSAFLFCSLRVKKTVDILLWLKRKKERRISIELRERKRKSEMKHLYVTVVFRLWRFLSISVVFIPRDFADFRTRPETAKEFLMQLIQMNHHGLWEPTVEIFSPAQA